MNLRRTSSLLLALALLAPTAIPHSVSAQRTVVNVTVDGEPLATDVIAYSENGRTMVPMRPIFEALHAKVTWNDKTKTVTGTTADTTVTL